MTTPSVISVIGICHNQSVATWNEFAVAAPELAQRVRDLFRAHQHHTMATLRKDGSPRISGTEIRIVGDDVVLDMMRGAIRATDLRRDPRVAIHSCTADPDEDPIIWGGDTKISGTVSEVVNNAEPPDSHRFLVDLDEVVVTRVGTPADHLIIETWHPDRGLQRVERH